MSMKRFVLVVFVIMVSAFSIAFTLYQAAGVGLFSSSWWDQDRAQQAGEADLLQQQVTKEFSVTGLEKVEINMAAADINIISQDCAEIELLYRGQGDLEAVLQAGQLRIEENKTLQLGKMQNGSLTLNVPEDILLDWEINNAAGKVTVEHLHTGYLKSRVSAGDINFDYLEVDRMDCVATAGSIKISNGIVKKGNIEATAGEIVVDLTDSAEGLSIKALAGNIELTVPEDPALQVAAKTHAGQVDSEVPLFINEQADLDINVVASAGSIEIKQR